MRLLDMWLDETIDQLYHLNDEKRYLKAVEVRGHRHLLKQKAKKYLLAEAEKLIHNKLRRRRCK